MTRPGLGARAVGGSLPMRPSSDRPLGHHPVPVDQQRHLAGGPQREVGSALRRIAHLEGVVLVSQKSAASGPLAWQNRNMAGNLRPVHGELVRDNGADRRMHDRRLRPVAGLHVVGAALVVPFLRREGADHGQRVHLLGDAFVRLRHPQLRVLRPPILRRAPEPRSPNRDQTGAAVKAGIKGHRLPLRVWRQACAASRRFL